MSYFNDFSRDLRGCLFTYLTTSDLFKLGLTNQKHQSLALEAIIKRHPIPLFMEIREKTLCNRFLRIFGIWKKALSEGKQIILIGMNTIMNRHPNYRVLRDDVRVGEGIKGITIEKCGLLQVSSRICNLRMLRHICFNNNALSELPESIGNLSSLQNLQVCHNYLQRLPPSIGRLTNLKELSLINNCLSTLPDSFTQLTGLQSLLLDHNCLHSLPSQMGSMTLLGILSLSNNQLNHLPEMGSLTRLDLLNIKSNPLESIPNLECLKLNLLDVSDDQIERFPQLRTIPGVEVASESQNKKPRNGQNLYTLSL